MGGGKLTKDRVVYPVLDVKFATSHDGKSTRKRSLSGQGLCRSRVFLGGRAEFGLVTLSQRGRDPTLIKKEVTIGSKIKGRALVGVNRQN